MIYFVQPYAFGPVKIGHACVLRFRLQSLEYIYGRNLSVLKTIEGSYDVEKEMHRRFHELRLGRTEQFRPGLALMTFIGTPELASNDPVEPMPKMPPGWKLAKTSVTASPSFSGAV